MPVPIVAVVGRSNVGKSTFVNRIAEVRDAIVHEQRGVTRDRSYHKADWNGREFLLVDTGGVEMDEQDAFQSSIRSQAIAAVEEADAVIFIVDAQVGITEEDEAVARLLRGRDVPLFLVANKVDDPTRSEGIWEFCSLGVGDPWPVSALHGNGTGDLLDALVDVLPEYAEPEDDDCINVAIVGRPNAGKSSLANRLVGSERSIVSDVAGTTRDAVDTVVEHEGTRYRIVDTAGMRKRSAIDGNIEYYGFVRALRAVERADVALLVVDATVGLTDQDQRVAGLTKEQGCSLVVLLNKWDLIETPERREELVERITDRLVFVGYAPLLRVSALTGRSVGRIWGAVDASFENAGRSIPTNRLNNLLTEIREFGHTVNKGQKRLKLNYVTQTGTHPPFFTFFANFPELVDDNYERYLEGRLRERFDLAGTPIRMKFRKKDR
jgi:GTP-binding protein